jgi:hypothetical protein
VFSINPQKPRDGPILFGGSNPGQAKFEEWLDENPERCVDDNIPGFPAVTDAVKEFAEAHFACWPTDSDLYKRCWSGIIAMVRLMNRYRFQIIHGTC